MHPVLVCCSLFFFFNDTATTEIYTLSLHDALPISLFRMVGVNSAFYESPSETILDAYARVLPQGYACNAKVWDRITARRSEEHTSELQSPCNLVCRLLLEKKNRRTSRHVSRASPLT